MNKQEKARAVESLAGSVGKAENAFLVEYKGLSVPVVTELRKQIRESKSSYLVVKNTLALRAIEKTPLGALAEHFTGPIGVAYNRGDAVALAKVLHNFQKSNPAISFRAGLVERQVVRAEQIKTIADLPSRDELIARIVFMLSSPLTRLVRVLNGPLTNFVSVLHQVAEQKAQ